MNVAIGLTKGAMTLAQMTEPIFPSPINEVDTGLTVRIFGQFLDIS